MEFWYVHGFAADKTNDHSRKYVDCHCLPYLVFWNVMLLVQQKVTNGFYTKIHLFIHSVTLLRFEGRFELSISFTLLTWNSGKLA
jgi:hypothetical protein